jgi:L-ascorbate metabolism protein UlaG (beta-lactamase superfamily)
MTVMDTRVVCLRPNVACEPLFNQWYAWPYLLSPASSAMYVANYHVKLMTAFVAAPRVHVEALKKPEMLGGPFIDYPVERVPDVRDLLERTKRENRDLLELAAAIKDLDALLEHMDGTSLEPLYAKVPEPLRGRVELVYDRRNHADFRLLEELFYRSSYYKPSAQTIGLKSLDGDLRRFVLSSPRLSEPSFTCLEIPFASPLVDELARARLTPKPLGFYVDALRLPASAPLEDLFTETAPSPGHVPVTAGVRIRYFGHACLLIESRRLNVLCDPLIPYKHANGSSRYGFDDLPQVIDYVVLTHNHQDHVLLETLLQLRHRVRHVVVPASAGGSLVDPSLRLLLRHLGFRSVLSLDGLERIEFDGGSITALPFLGEHADLDVRTKAAHLIQMEGTTVLCAADSNNIEPRLYAHLAEFVGNVDVVFIGMECQGAPMSWLYGPLFTAPILRKQDQSRRLDGSNYAKAIDIVERLRPKEVYVYAMGAEPWLKFISSIEYTDTSTPIVESAKLVDACRQRGIRSERLFGPRDIHLG